MTLFPVRPDVICPLVRTGGLVLAGGHSRRMGTSKAWLSFGGQPMLARIVGILQTLGPVAVVGAVGQELPPLPEGVRVLRDRVPDRGPVEGLAVGLAALADEADMVFVSGCDTPLLAPAFMHRVLERLGADANLPAADVCVPRHAGELHSLSAAYRPHVAPEYDRLIAEGRMRPLHLFDRVPTRILEPADLLDVDPELRSLLNANAPEEFAQALKLAGLED